mgnify:CR=1 FL=1
MIEVREVKSRKEIREFLNFTNKLYKGNKCFVPPIYMDEKKCFKANYMYYDQAEAKYWNAYKDGKMVGRISAIIQHKANEKWGQKRCRFTRFDAIDDQEVAKALFDTVEAYAKEKGMEEVVGPLGFSDLEREGLLIEGFEHLSTFEEQYNHSYYQKLIEGCGYGKDVDWIEHKLTINHEKYAKIERISDKILEKGNYKLVPVMSYSKLCKKYGDQFFELLDISYDKIYGTVPFTQGMKNLLMNNFKPIVNPRYTRFIVNKDDKVVAFAIAFPNIAKAMQTRNGHLTPLTIIRLLHTVRHPKIIDLGLVGVLPEEALGGSQIVMFKVLSEQIIKDKIQYVETNLNLEDNHEIIRMWDHFNSIQHKRRRSFVKHI